MKNNTRTAVWLTAGRLLAWGVVFLCLSASLALAKKTHTIFFEGTDHELNVYRSFGQEKGKTVLLIGGIQGDEPGGFLSVDLYADMSLAKGNLIVVPRANFQSILLNRRKVNDDMNRQFAGGTKDTYETKVVSILKRLIAESDLVLNLHDGSGFFSETWQGPDRNPGRYGQSIIADCDVYHPGNGAEPVRLGDMARTVASRINQQIQNRAHHFHFNNHRTSEKDSAHAEQRKSATYYALYTCGIPAFGIETSKSLPLEQKVRQHNLAVNAFMEMMGIEPETPGIRLETPELRYLIISVNDSLPILVENHQKLYVKPGDTIRVTHIEANYERGLTADILGVGTLNDTRKKIRITDQTRIIVRKDYYPCGSVQLAVGKGVDRFAHGVSVADHRGIGMDHTFFKVKVNGKSRVYHKDDCVRLVRGDTISIEEVVTSIADPAELVVNFKGFVGDEHNNTGEDRGYVIHTARDLWKRYAMDPEGRRYQVVVIYKQEVVGKLFVELEEPTLDYVVLKTGDTAMQCLSPGQTFMLETLENLELVDIITNGYRDLSVSVFISGPDALKRYPLEINTAIPLERLANPPVSGPYRMEIQRDQVNIGTIFFHLSTGDAS